MRALKAKVPWWIKIGSKIILSRLPVAHQQWDSLGIFKHGQMNDPSYALDVFNKHFAVAAPFLPPDYVALEMGPGNSLLSALPAYFNGSAQIYLVDIAPFATKNVDIYNAALDTLNLRSRKPQGFESLEAFCAFTNAIYLTEGLKSYKSIPGNSVHFIFSQAVLEHVALNEFKSTIEELYRIQPPGGVCSHKIDLRDHLQTSINSLRFKHDLWESDLMAKSGFYTNRLRASQIRTIFEAAGYKVLEETRQKWDSIPVPRTKLDRDFASLSDDDLLTSGQIIFAQKPY